jgi:serine/threonine protein kinase
MCARRAPDRAGSEHPGGAHSPAGEAMPGLTLPTQSMSLPLEDATIPEPDASESDLPLPTESQRIGHFIVLHKLGAGGMGVVYAAYDDALDRKVAIKILYPREDDPSRTTFRLRREAQAMAKLSHPNVVQVFEVGEYEKRLFLAMEFVHGQTLDEWQGDAPVDGGDDFGFGFGFGDAAPAPAPAPAEPQRRSWREIVAMHLQAGHGLAAAHRAGLVHRDYKPSNVIVSQDGRARVLDFGLARRDDTSETRASRPSLEASFSDSIGGRNPLEQSITMEGAVLGTPRYMSPEQITGQVVDARSDQFSFCVALFEALYGINPFASPNLGARMLRIMNDEVVPPPPGIDVPAWVHAAVVRGLRREPAARWPSMEALLAELTQEPEESASTESLLRRARRHLLGGVLAFALIAVITLLVHEHIAAAQRAATSPVGALLVSLLVSSVVGVVAVLGRRTLLATRVGRRIAASAAITCGGIVLTRVVPVFLDVPFEHGFVYGQIVIACTAAATAVSILRPLYWLAALWLALIPFTLWQIEHAAALQSLGLLLSCAMGLRYWARR